MPFPPGTGFFSWRLLLGCILSWMWSLLVCIAAYRVIPFSIENVQICVWGYGLSLPFCCGIAHIIRFAYWD